MQTVRCPACRGAKEVMSLGMRVLKCKTCAGIGHVAAAIKDVQEEEKELVPVVKRRRKKIEKIDVEETEKESSAMQGFCESLDDKES